MHVSGGVALTLCGPTPATYPMPGSMGGNISRKTNCGSECEATGIFLAGLRLIRLVFNILAGYGGKRGILAPCAHCALLLE